jgi:hypothetical protein
MSHLEKTIEIYKIIGKTFVIISILILLFALIEILGLLITSIVYGEKIYGLPFWMTFVVGLITIGGSLTIILAPLGVATLLDKSKERNNN